MIFQCECDGERDDECTCGGCACFKGRLDVYIKGSSIVFSLRGWAWCSRLFILIFYGVDLLD